MLANPDFRYPRFTARVHRYDASRPHVVLDTSWPLWRVVARYATRAAAQRRARDMNARERR